MGKAMSESIPDENSIANRLREDTLRIEQYVDGIQEEGACPAVTAVRLALHDLTLLIRLAIREGKYEAAEGIGTALRSTLSAMLYLPYRQKCEEYFAESLSVNMSEPYDEQWAVARLDEARTAAERFNWQESISVYERVRLYFIQMFPE